MNTTDAQYLTQMQRLLRDGERRPTRSGECISLFGAYMRHHLDTGGFPILTTKRVHFPSVVKELLWMLSGSTNVRDLQAMGCSIWDEWADPATGDLGPIYGQQWRAWGSEPFYSGIDQIAQLIDGIKRDPYSRRHIVSAWNVADIPDMALPPCHVLVQFHVDNAGYLSAHLYQRSADWFLGAPFNIAQYSLLLCLIARECSLRPGTFHHSFGDFHLYANHEAQAREQIQRAPRQLPQLRIAADAPGIFDLMPHHITLENYDPHPKIEAPVSV